VKVSARKIATTETAVRAGSLTEVAREEMLFNMLHLYSVLVK
jgi:hypothetical protein